MIKIKDVEGFFSKYSQTPIKDRFIKFKNDFDKRSLHDIYLDLSVTKNRIQNDFKEMDHLVIEGNKLFNKIEEAKK